MPITIYPSTLKIKDQNGSFHSADCIKGDVGPQGPHGSPIDVKVNGVSVVTGDVAAIDISGKADKVSNATTGNLAALDANGNLTDSGNKAIDFVTGQAFTSALSAKQDTLTFDNVPTASSDNPVKSGGIKSSIDAVANSIPTKVSDLTNDAGYLTESNKVDISQLAVPPTMIETGVVYPGIFVFATSGETGNNSSYASTDYIDLSGVYQIRYKRTKTSATTSNAGMAFYNANKQRIDGILTVRGQDGIGYYGMWDAIVPDGAKYARFTMLADTQTYGSFELYAVMDGAWKLDQKADKTAVETISGSDPVIVGIDNHRYVCGTCDTLTLTPPSSGIMDVVFTSDTTPTVLSVTPPPGKTMLWPGWFNPSALDASTVYEINIMDGVYGAVGKWT